MSQDQSRWDAGPGSELIDEGRAGAGNLFKRAWWAMALRGLFAILLGIAIISSPGRSLRVFISMLGIYLFLDGLFTLAATFSAAQRGRSWWPYLLEGALSVGAGILAFTRPASALLFVVLLLAVRAIVVGAVELGTGFSVRKETGASPWLLWLGGIVSVAFGVMLFARPGIGAFALIWTVGVYAVIFGILMDVEAFRLKDHARSLIHRTST
jgi:uncharacterized membrane protein HdeD (DUF308 family)